MLVTRLSMVSAVAIIVGAVIGLAAIGQDYTLKVNSDLVLLDVGVKDAKGNYVAGLGKENFQVLENGRLQTVTQFAHDDAPVTVGLVIDTSGSMLRKYSQVVAAASIFLGASNPKDEIFVVNFNDKVIEGQPPDQLFSDNTEKLRATLNMTRPSGQTALYDAVIQGLTHLGWGKQDKKTLLLVSDGGDNRSKHTLEDVRRMVEQSRATIYTIGLFDEDNPDRNPKVLRQLSDISGGETYLPQETNEVLGICRQIAADIRARYTVGYVPSEGSAKGVHKVKVNASESGGRKLIVHSRSSYLVP